MLLVTATRLASTTHPGDTRTRANIKIHIVQDRQGRALSPPPHPHHLGKTASVQNQQLGAPSSSQQCHIRRAEPQDEARGCVVTSSDALDSSPTPAQPIDPTILRAPKRTKRALELQVTPCDLVQAPWPSALMSKDHTSRHEGAGRDRGLPGELGHKPVLPSRLKAASCSGRSSEAGLSSLPHMPMGPRSTPEPRPANA